MELAPPPPLPPLLDRSLQSCLDDEWWWWEWVVAGAGRVEEGAGLEETAGLAILPAVEMEPVVVVGAWPRDEAEPSVWEEEEAEQVLLVLDTAIVVVTADMHVVAMVDTRLTSSVCGRGEEDICGEGGRW